MVLLRGILFSLLLMVGTLVSAQGAESLASTPMGTGVHAVAMHSVTRLATAEHCKTVAASDRHGASHDGCCRDMNCGVCAHSGIAALPLIGEPALTIDVHAPPIPVSPMVGRTIAPETGPPKSFA